MFFASFFSKKLKNFADIKINLSSAKIMAYIIMTLELGKNWKNFKIFINFLGTFTFQKGI